MDIDLRGVTSWCYGYCFYITYTLMFKSSYGQHVELYKVGCTLSHNIVIMKYCIKQYMISYHRSRTPSDIDIMSSNWVNKLWCAFYVVYAFPFVIISVINTRYKKHTTITKCLFSQSFLLIIHLVTLKVLGMSNDRSTNATGIRDVHLENQNGSRLILKNVKHVQIFSWIYFHM